MHEGNESKYVGGEMLKSEFKHYVSRIEFDGS